MMKEILIMHAEQIHVPSLGISNSLHPHPIPSFADSILWKISFLANCFDLKRLSEGNKRPLNFVVTESFIMEDLRFTL